MKNDNRPKVHYLSVHFEDGTDLNIVSSNGETHIWPSPEVVDSTDHVRVAREYRAAPELLAVLEYVEWVENEEDERFYCPCCDSERGIGHHDDCQLASALARARAEASGSGGRTEA